jgi:heme exporter protein CcmD
MTGVAMLSDAFKMGSYGAYVWSSYGLTLLGLLFMAFAARRSWRIELKQARRRAQAASMTASMTSEQRP